MFFIGGYSGNVPKLYGPAARLYCFSCAKEGDFLLLRERSSVFLFLIPMPVKTSYYMVCPHCGHRTVISKEQFREYLKGMGRRE